MVFNLISQLIFGSLLEQMVGFKQMACLYIVSGIGGNLLSSMINDECSVGASTAVFGVLTGQVAMVLVNWNAFSSPQLKQVRCMMIAFVIVMLVINFITDLGQVGVVDIWGHIGGAIAGFLYGVGFFPREISDSSHKIKVLGMSLTAMYFTIIPILFFLTRRPKDPYWGTYGPDDDDLGN